MATATKPQSMFDMIAERDALEAVIAEQDGELRPDQEAAWDTINLKFEDKVHSTALLICERKANAEMIKAEAGKLMDRARALENDADRLHELLANRMRAFGKEKVAGLLKTVAFQKGNWVVTPVVPMDDNDLRNIATFAPEFIRHKETWALDMKAVADAAKAGTLPDDLAKRVEVKQSVSLRIR